jgi:hypothetical protein
VNAKLAKMLRGPAQYRNQSATPGVTPFPGIMRMYRHPVYSTRITTKTSFIRLPMEDKVTKVFTRVRHMVVDRWGKPIVEMVTHSPGTLPVAFGDDGKPTEFNKHVVVQPKEQVVPVVKPVRLDPTCAKAKYRALKRLGRKGLLIQTGAAIIDSLKEVPA